ncbi:MAG: 4Fe-4S binding protein [Acidimicrobiales bacterium]
MTTPTRGAVVIDYRCTACGMCVATCPTHALLRARHRPVVVAERCTGCLACIEVCPRDAVSEL